MTDKKLLIDIKNEVVLHLKARGKLDSFVLLKRPIVAQDNCDGWEVQFARIKNTRCFAGLWLDHYLSHKDRKLQYSIWTDSDPEGFEQIAQKLNQRFGSPLNISNSNVSIATSRNVKNKFSLKRPLQKGRFSKIILEDYSPEKERLYGRYEFKLPDNSHNRKEELVRKSLVFFYTVIAALQDTSTTDDRPYPQIENRLSVERHLKRERRGRLLEQRKALDEYVCEICDFDFAAIYGDLGYQFAEAHHIIPLANNNQKRTTTIQDLVTVCSNCHRMLHKMPGAKTDIPRLKSIVKSNRKNFR